MKTIKEILELAEVAICDKRFERADMLFAIIQLLKEGREDQLKKEAERCRNLIAALKGKYETWLEGEELCLEAKKRTWAAFKNNVGLRQLINRRNLLNEILK